jgi:hypothetical protein
VLERDGRRADVLTRGELGARLPRGGDGARGVGEEEQPGDELADPGAAGSVGSPATRIAEVRDRCGGIHRGLRQAEPEEQPGVGVRGPLGDRAPQEGDGGLHRPALRRVGGRGLQRVDDPGQPARRGEQQLRPDLVGRRGSPVQQLRRQRVEPVALVRRDPPGRPRRGRSGGRSRAGAGRR